MTDSSNTTNSLAHTKWNCKYHIVFAPKYRRTVFMKSIGKSATIIFQKFGNMKFAYRNREFWCKGYYVDTVGKNTKAIQEYVANQLKADKEADQLSLFDPRDPLTGSK